jgi:hypothetical protein
MRSDSSASTLVTDPNQISVLHRYGDLDLRKCGQNLSQDAQIRSPRPSRAWAAGLVTLDSFRVSVMPDACDGVETDHWRVLTPSRRSGLISFLVWVEP